MCSDNYTFCLGKLCVTEIFYFSVFSCPHTICIMQGNMKWSEYMRKYSLLLIQTMMSSLHNFKLCNGKISCFMDQFPFRAHFIEVTKVRLCDPMSLRETTKAHDCRPLTNEWSTEAEELHHGGTEAQRHAIPNFLGWRTICQFCQQLEWHRTVLLSYNNSDIGCLPEF